MKHLFIFFLFLLLFKEGYSENQTTELRINGKILHVEIVRTRKSQKKGLQKRVKLAENSGMIFIYSQPKKLSFWMKNTTIPLSIAFIDQHGTILQIEKMNPGSLTTVRSKQKCLYALEVNSNWFAKNNITTGDFMTCPENKISFT